MARKRKPAAPADTDSAETAQVAAPPGPLPASESLDLNLSAEQRGTILKYAELPPPLSARLATAKPSATSMSFTLDELDELLDYLEWSVYRAKGNEKQKVLRIVQKISKSLGSAIEQDQILTQRLPNLTDTVFQIKMTLQNIDPPIWRRIQTQDCTLDDLHALIQIAMGWECDHLYCFHIAAVEFADVGMVNDEDVMDACDTTLSEVIPVENRRPRFEYEYDFGDRWKHQLIVEERFLPQAGVKYPVCVEGQRACPPEDCGGHWGYSRLLNAIANAKRGEHDEMLEWLGSDFDPERFDLKAVNSKLRRLRTRKR